MDIVSPLRIIKCDERPWLLHPKGTRIWGELECRAAQVKIDGDGKDSITVLTCVIAAGAKFPLAFLRQEKRRALRNRKSVQSMEIGALSPKASGRSQKCSKAT